MHVRGFTMHASSKTDSPGTYLGAANKLDHLKVSVIIVAVISLRFPMLIRN